MPVLVPDSLAAACALLVEDRERIVLAGGTDLLVAWPQRFDRHGATYVDVSKLTELRTISFAGDALVLGAASVAAGFFPARRATHVDPVEAMRAE